MVEGVWLGWGARADVVSGSAGGREVCGGAGLEKYSVGCWRVIVGSVWRMAFESGWCGACRIEGYGGGGHVGGGREVWMFPDVYGMRDE